MDARVPVDPEVPQPGPERMVPAAGHPFILGVVPGQPALVALTAASWAAAAGASHLFCAYADESRFAVEELADGRVRHAPVDPDGLGEDWRQRERGLEEHLGRVLAASRVPWSVRYLAGRPDRALTHLARAVDAAVFVIGARSPGRRARLREVVEGSVALRLAHHQHRPVLVVPVQVVDWAQDPWG